MAATILNINEISLFYAVSCLVKKDCILILEFDLTRAVVLVTGSSPLENFNFSFDTSG